MKHSTSTLPDFLLTRIAEDEAAARLASPEAAKASWGDDETEHSGYGWFSVDYWGPENEAHGSRWDPARVLAECEAKRLVVETVCYEVGPVGERESWLPYDETGERVLRLLALPYAIHPDYSEKWRP